MKQKVNNWFHFLFGKVDHHLWTQTESGSHLFVCAAASLKQKQYVSHYNKLVKDMDKVQCSIND